MIFSNAIILGNTLVAKELSHHVLNQQQKIKTLDTTSTTATTTSNNPMSSQSQQNTVSLNASRAKLSQIQVKPKSSTTYQSQSLSKSTNPVTSNNNNNNESTSSGLADLSVSSATARRSADLANRPVVCKARTEPEPMFSAEIFKAAEAEKLEKLEKLEVLKRLRVLEEPALSKPQGLYTYAVTSSCQLRECFYNNRSLINTSSNSTNQLVYHRNETLLAAVTGEEASGGGRALGQLAEEAGVRESEGNEMPIETKNTKKNRRLYKDLEFIYNEQQVFKLSRQIWLVIYLKLYCFFHTENKFLKLYGSLEYF
jgi:hypothetical protein